MDKCGEMVRGRVGEGKGGGMRRGGGEEGRREGEKMGGLVGVCVCERWYKGVCVCREEMNESIRIDKYT